MRIGDWSLRVQDWGLKSVGQGLRIKLQGLSIECWLLMFEGWGIIILYVCYQNCSKIKRNLALTKSLAVVGKNHHPKPQRANRFSMDLRISNIINYSLLCMGTLPQQKINNKEFENCVIGKTGCHFSKPGYKLAYVEYKYE